MTQPQVYLSGPIQHVEDHGKEWRDYVEDAFMGYEWVNPFDKYDTTEVESIEWEAETIVEDDLECIRSSDAVLVHWEEVPTCGTPMEIAYAYSDQIPVVVHTDVPDDDLSPWLTYHADHVEHGWLYAVERLDELFYDA